MRIAICLLLSALSVLASVSYGPFLYPPLGPNQLQLLAPTYYWASSSLASGNLTGDWVDASNSLHLTPNSLLAANVPTNNAAANAGVFFNGQGSCYVTNAGINLPTSGTWAVALVLYWITNGTTAFSGDIGGDYAGANGPTTDWSDDTLNWFFSGANHKGPQTFPVATRFDVVYGMTNGVGKVYTNGVLYTNLTIAVPTWKLACFGDDTGSDPYRGYIQKIAIFTNSFPTATVWDSWCGTNNPGQ